MSVAVNVIEVNDWKAVAASKKEARSLAKYYSLLSLSELLNEATLTAKDISFSDVSPCIEIQIRALINELKNRVQSSTIFKQGLEQIAQTLESNLKILLA